VAHDGFGSYRPQHGGASSPLGIQSQGKPNDLRWHRDLAVAELEHLARFRKRAAAREIREPLAHYAALLRAVRDDPASRVFVDSR
jgi:hypothetical protein